MDPSKEKGDDAILGMFHPAESCEVQEAFRHLAKRRYPDHINTQRTRKFPKAQELMKVLSNLDNCRYYKADLRRSQEQASNRSEPLNPLEGRMSCRRSCS